MQTTSATWKALWASGDAWLDVRATINGTVYTAMTAPVINRAMMQQGLSIGSAVAATCSMTVRTTATIPKSATVTLEMRLTDGTTASEWLPAGTYYISHRSRDPINGLVTLECYDAMLKSNAEYTATGAWPRAMSDMVTELAGLLGVAVDSRTVIETGSAYTVSLPDTGTTINTILCGIAAVHGGNWVITPAGKLRLVPVVSAAGAAGASVAAVVSGIVGGISVEDAQSVTGLRVHGDDGDTIIGSESGLVVDVDSQYINATNAADLGGKLIGQTYQSYTLTGAIYDPASELGDYVRGGASGEVASVLYGEIATLGTAYRGDITALEVPELADEYPYIGKSEAMAAQIRRLTVVVADKASLQDLEAVDARLDNLTASDIKTGLIHSADYQTVVIPMIYPASDLFPAADLFPNYGEQIIRGFAIDFATGQIYGAFYSDQIEGLQTEQESMAGLITQLQSAVTALQDALVYPKAAPTRLAMFPARGGEPDGETAKKSGAQEGNAGEKALALDKAALSKIEETGEDKTERDVNEPEGETEGDDR